jgi:transposase
MLAALIAGERARVLAQLAPGRMRAKRSVLEEAFTGFSRPLRVLVGQDVARVAVLDADIAELDHKLEKLIVPFAQAVDRLGRIAQSGWAGWFVAAAAGYPTSARPAVGPR